MAALASRCGFAKAKLSIEERRPGLEKLLVVKDKERIRQC